MKPSDAPVNLVVVVAHAPLASALATCALHVLPSCAQDLVAVDIDPQASTEESLALAQKLLAQHLAQLGYLGSTRTLLVLTDVQGATPFNIACILVENTHSPLLCGVNLPMLLRSLCYRQEALSTVVERALEGAHHGVLQAR